MGRFRAPRSGFIGSGLFSAVLAAAPAAECVGLPLFWGSPSPSVTSFPAFAILGLAWEETSVALPGNRNRVMTSRCAGNHPAPSPGAARPSGSVGAGHPSFPPSDTGCKECPGLNGPCVKMWGGGQSPSTPLKAGQEQEAAPQLGCTHSQSSARGEGPLQTLHVSLTLLPTLWPNSKPACARSSVHRPGACTDHTRLHPSSFQAVFRESKKSSILEESKAGRP